jgi:hypothetical protein
MFYFVYFVKSYHSAETKMKNMHRQECFSLNLQHIFRGLHYYFQFFTITIYRLILQDIYKTNLFTDKYML